MEQQEIVEKLRKNPAALQSLMHSQDGQSLMRALQGNDGGKTLNHAAMQAAGGNTAEMMRLLQQVMGSPEGSALVHRIEETLKKQG